MKGLILSAAEVRAAIEGRLTQIRAARLQSGGPPMTPAAARKRERRGWRKAKGIAPARDRKYLAWIRTLPCVVCWPKSWHFLGEIVNPHIVLSEAAHVGDTGKGMRQKCSDYETVPLCAAHHRVGKHAHHAPGMQRGKFWQHHGLDRDALIAAAQRQFSRQILGEDAQ